MDDEPAFDWDEANEGHIWDRHRIKPWEAEEALLSPGRVGLGRRRADGEDRWLTVGPTLGGRLLVIVYTRRKNAIRVVTARPANSGEERLYRRHRK